MVNGWGVDFILALGENTTTGWTEGEIDSVIIDNDIGKYYHQWIKPYNGSYGPGSPDINRFFPMIGNHDYYYHPYGVGLQAYLDYFDLTPYSTTSGNERYYNVRWSDDVELFILNNYDGWRTDDYDQGESEPDGWTVGSVQEQWLQTQMAASTATFKIVAIHHPPYSSNFYQFCGSWPDARWDFKGMGADVVLSAHWGNYERLIIDNLLYIVNGVGGARLATPDCFGGGFLNGSQVGLIEYGALRIEINGSAMTINFFNENGVIKDSYVIDKSLPVELTSFTSSITGNVVKLKWETATEVNNYGFKIERKAPFNPPEGGNVGEWNTIGFVEGHGNSNSPKHYSFVDNEINQSGIYYYRLKQIDNDGTYEYSTISSVNVGVPGNYYLSQNYPNPFNPTTKIDFTIPEKQLVSLRIYNVLGDLVQELVNEEKAAGSYSITFNASNLPSGVYIYRLQTPSFSQNRKMTLLK